MDTIIVGNENCSFNAIILALQKCRTFSILVNNWRKLATALDTNQVIVDILQQNMILHLFGPSDILLELLNHWKARNGSKATLVELIRIFKDECQWNEFADCLVAKFDKLTVAESWDELGKKEKGLVLERQVKILGLRKPLGHFCNCLGEAATNKIFAKSLTKEVMLELLESGSDISLAFNSIPEKAKYYISRVLSPSCRVDSAIFQQKCADKFVFEEIELSDLSKIAQKQELEMSGTQNTDRFILLNFKEEFNKICVTAGGTPVHLFNFENGIFRWVKTQGSMSLIQDYISTEQDSVDENNFFGEISGSVSQNSVSYVFSDSPGKGKSVFLAALAEYVKSKCPQSLVIYLSLPDFVNKFINTGQGITIESVVGSISAEVATNSLGKEIIHKLILCKEQRVELFLDSFDEIYFSKIKTALQIFACINSADINLRLFVTTRPHMKRKLEQTLGVLAYSFVPFRECDQVEFLLKYWLDRHRIRTTENLKLFGKSLLDFVMAKLDDDSLALVGAPMQLKMVADIYAEDAGNYSKTENLKFGVGVTVTTMFQMYEALLQTRFAKIENYIDRKSVRNAHVRLAINTIFPHWAEKVGPLFDLSGVSNELVELYKTGIVEPALNDGDNSRPKFIHKTIAEFLVAEFVSKFIIYGGEGTGDKESKVAMTRVIFEDVLKCNKLDGSIPVGKIDCGYEELVMNLRSKVLLPEKKLWRSLAVGLDVERKCIQELETMKKYSEETNSASLDLVRLVLNQWGQEKGKHATLGLLVKSLNLMDDWKVAADHIKSQYFQHSFVHSALNYFLNGHLANAEPLGNEACPTSQLDSSHLHNCHPPSTILFDVLTSCVRHDYSNLAAVLCSHFVNITRNNISTHFSTPNWSNLLITAARYSDKECFKTCLNLVKSIYRVDSLDEFSFSYFAFDNVEWSPLHEAIRRGNFAMVHYLVNTLEVSLSGRKCLLHYCTQNSSMNTECVVKLKIEILKVLYDRDPNIINEVEPTNNRTPLLMNNVHFDLVKYLIEAGADNSIKTEKEGETVAHRVLWHFNATEFHEFVKLMMNVKIKNESIFCVPKATLATPIHDALQYLEVKLDTLELLHSELGLKFDKTDNEGDTEFLCAVVGGRSRNVLQKLVHLGADWTQKRRNKQTVLHVAALAGNVDALIYFIGLGADVNAKDDSKQSPLHIALHLGMANLYETVKILLENKADTNAVDSDKKKPIWYAENRSDHWLVEKRTFELLSKDNKNRDKECCTDKLSCFRLK